MISGYRRQIGYLDAARRRGRLAHAYFFYGPDTVWTVAVAEALARALHCPNYRGLASIVKNGLNKGNYRGLASIVGAGDECQECRMIDGNVHPYVIRLDLAHTLVSDKADRKEIPIEDIRELKRRFALAAPAGQWRIAIIGQADKMSPAAADAFLKLLEEPGQQTLFMLIAPAREIVSETIASRCVPVGFLAQGAPPDKKLREVLSAAYAAGIPEVLVLSEKFARDAEGRDKIGAAALAYGRERMLSASDAQKARLARRLGRMLEIFHLMKTTNVNPRLALDALLLE